MSPEAQKPTIAPPIAEQEVAKLIVDTLRLETSAADLDATAPLFGEGLGLDSIDMLEIALSVSKRYGFDLRSEDRAAFASVRALTTHIEQHRTK
jgi:acyl carrier protein